MKSRFLLSISLFFAFATSANAVIQANRCNSCSESQYLTIATNVAEANSQTHGFVSVYDLVRHNFRKYSVEAEPDVGGMMYTLSPVTLTTLEFNAWTAEDHVIAENAGHSTFFYHTDLRDTWFAVPHKNETAFNIMQTVAFQNDIENWLANKDEDPLITDIMNSLGGALNVITLKSDIISLTWTLTTADGGTLDFYLVAGQSKATLTRALDPNGNTIPTNINQLTGHYRLGPGREPNFQDYLHNRFGNNVIFGPNVCLNGIMACTQGPYGYNCEWFSCGGVP